MATNSLGTLTLDLVAKIGGFTAPLDQAERSAKKSARGMADAARGATAAWSGLGSALAGLFAGVSVGAVFSKFITETKNAEAEQAQLAAVLKSTGEAAGFSRDQLNDMAAAMEGRSLISAGDINTAQTALLAFTGVVGDQFTVAMQAAMDMSARTGMTVTQAAETIGRALDVPSKGLTALSKQGFRFTDDQKALAKQLEASGKTAEAQGIILSALQESYGGAAQAARDTFGGALAAVQNTISGLMTGQDGSLEGARIAIEELNSALADPATAAGVATITDAMAAMATKVIQSVPFVIDAGDGVVRVFDVLANTLIGMYATAAARVQNLAADVMAALSVLPDFAGGADFAQRSAQYRSDAQSNFSIAAQAAEQIRNSLETPLKGTAMAEFARQAKAAGDALGVKPKSGSSPDASGAAAAEAAAKAAAAQTKKQTGEIERMTKALVEQAATLGMTEQQLTRYKFEQAGATAEQLKAVDGIAAEIALRKEIAKAVAQQADALREQRAVEREIESFRQQQGLAVQGMGLGNSRREQLDAEYQIQQEYAQKRLDLEEAQRVESTRLDVEAYKQRVDALQSAESQKIDIVRESTAQRLQAEQDWALGVQESLQNYLDESGNMYAQAAEATTSVMNAATSSISDGLQGLVDGTQSVGDAFADLATGMADAMLSAMADIAAQWLVHQAMEMAGIQATTAAKVSGATTAAAAEVAAIGTTTAAAAAATATTTATQAAAAATTTAAWTPAAIVSSIGSFGTAAAIGLAAVVAALAFKGFRTGGYTGGGGVDDIAGVVHGKEFVFDAAATSRIGVSNLEALRAGKTLDGAVASVRAGGGIGGSGMNVNQVLNINGDVSPQTVELIQSSQRQVFDELARDAKMNGPYIQMVRSKM